MKKWMMLLTLGLTFPALAADPAPEGESFGKYGVDQFMKTFISKSEVTVDGDPVTLIRYESAEGEVCQQYLAAAKKSVTAGVTNIKLTIDQFCGEPVKTPEGLAPKGFYGLTWVPEKDGMGHQVLKPAPGPTR